MTVDFHTHVFPDALAPKAMKLLTESIDNLYPPVHDGTVSGLINKMDSSGVDKSVILPVITKESQVAGTNRWISGVRSERIIGFGGIYPHSEDYKSQIDLVAGLGLKGIKFHAEYQDFILDDTRMLKIYDYALEKGLIIVHHAGADPGFTPPYKTSPERFLNVSCAMKGGVIVAAHLGGHAQWDGVYEILAGGGIYLDTSMGFSYYEREQFLKIVKKHGSDKILFASDSPWSDAGHEIAQIKSLPLPEGDIENILGLNAKKLLSL